MKFIAEIDIMPRAELLDPQGKTVANNMNHIDISGVEDVRIGKHIKMTLEAETEEEAKEKVDNACKKLLANAIMENYEFHIAVVEEIEEELVEMEEVEETETVLEQSNP